MTQPKARNPSNGFFSLPWRCASMASRIAPGISKAPGTVNYGEVFFIGTGTADPTTIKRVTWIRLGSVTHAFDSNQRFNELAFVPTPGGLSVTAPANRNLAPPGHYMLFILNGNGVPSVSKVIRII